jgi:hypothetical protein
LGITGPEAMVESWKKVTYGQSQMIRDSVQDVRHQDAPKAMKKLSSHQMTDSPKAGKVGLQDARSQDAPEAMENLLSQQVMDSPKAVKGGPQEQLCITGPEAIFKLWNKGTHGQFQMMSRSAQDVRTHEAPEAMEEIETVDLTASPIAEELYSPQQTNMSHYAQEIMTQEAPETMEEIETADLTAYPIAEKLSSLQQRNIPKEAPGGPQDQFHNTVPEAMVKFGKQSIPPQSRVVSLSVQDARNQDAPKAVPKIDGRTMTAVPFWTVSQN